MLLKTKDLKFKFDVRLHGNELDIVNQMAGMLRGGGKLPAVVVNQRYELVDGRKRVAAAKAAGLSEIEARVETFSDDNAERIYAMTAQLGSAEPLSEEDIRWNIRRLIVGGTSYETLVTTFSSKLTRPLAIKYVDDAFSVLNKERVSHAVTDMGNGVSRAKVMAKYGVTETQIKNSLRRKANISGPKGSILDDKSQMGVAVRVLSKKIESQGKRILQNINEGTVTNEDALNVISHTSKLIENIQSRVYDYATRVNQAVELRKKIARR